MVCLTTEGILESMNMVIRVALPNLSAPSKSSVTISSDATVFTSVWQTAGLGVISPFSSMPHALLSPPYTQELVLRCTCPACRLSCSPGAASLQILVQEPGPILLVPPRVAEATRMHA